MRVIPDPAESYTTCQNCSANLGFKVEDIVDDVAVGTWVVCPMCHNAVKLELSKLPKSWQAIIKWDDATGA